MEKQEGFSEAPKVPLGNWCGPYCATAQPKRGSARLDRALKAPSFLFLNGLGCARLRLAGLGLARLRAAQTILARLSSAWLYFDGLAQVADVWLEKPHFWSSKKAAFFIPQYLRVAAFTEITTLSLDQNCVFGQ